MSTVTFDTHKFIRRLKESGMEEKQAEAIVDGFSEAQAEAQPVTKELFEVQLSLQSEQISLQIEKAKSDTVKWVAGLLLAQAALVATIMKLLALV